MQKHWDVMRTDNAGEQWNEVSGNLPTDFGFPIDVHLHEPETIYVVPITERFAEHYPPDGKLRVYRSKTGGNEWEALTKGLPQKDCYVNVLRDAMAVDSARSVRHLFRHDRRPGLRLGRRRQLVERHRARPAGGLFGRSANAAMIRVVLPFHLRNLARVDGEVELEVGARSRLRGARRARSTLSRVAGNDSRPRHTEAPSVRQIFRVQGRFVARTAGDAVAGRSCRAAQNRS